MPEPLFRRARARRIGSERRFLLMLAEANPGRLTVHPDLGDSISVSLPDTPFYDSTLQPARGLRARLLFPDYYPSVPIEAFIDPPAAHPNVHPTSGFICLWDTRHRGVSAIEAVLQIQRVVSCLLSNPLADHLMQPDALSLPPLPFLPLLVPGSYYLQQSASEPPQSLRKRLN